MQRKLVGLILLAVLAGCSSEPAPQVEPLRGLDGKPIGENDFTEMPDDLAFAASEADNDNTVLPGDSGPVTSDRAAIVIVDRNDHSELVGISLSTGQSYVIAKSTPSLWVHDAMTSPDGTTLAVATEFNSVELGSITKVELIDLQTGERTLLTELDYRIGDMGWSPDGTSVYVTEWDPDGAAISTIREIDVAAGSAYVMSTLNSPTPIHIVGINDRGLVIEYSYSQSFTTHYDVLDRRTGRDLASFQSKILNERISDLSGDGSTVAVVKQRGGLGDSSYTVDIGGTDDEIALITGFDRGDIEMDSMSLETGREVNPVFSPDGQMLAYLSGSDRNYDQLVIVDPSTEDHQEVPVGDTLLSDITWLDNNTMLVGAESPDNRYMRDLFLVDVHGNITPSETGTGIPVGVTSVTAPPPVAAIPDFWQPALAGDIPAEDGKDPDVNAYFVIAGEVSAGESAAAVTQTNRLAIREFVNYGVGDAILDISLLEGLVAADDLPVGTVLTHGMFVKPEANASE